MDLPHLAIAVNNSLELDYILSLETVWFPSSIKNQIFATSCHPSIPRFFSAVMALACAVKSTANILLAGCNPRISLNSVYGDGHVGWLKRGVGKKRCFQMSFFTEHLRIRAESTCMGRIPGTSDFKGIGHYRTAMEIPGIKVFRFDAPLYFANAELFLTSMHWFVYFFRYVRSKNWLKVFSVIKEERLEQGNKEQKEERNIFYFLVKLSYYLDLLLDVVAQQVSIHL